MSLLAKLRTLLQKPPSSDLWWAILSLLDSTPIENKALYLAYVTEHVQQDPLWKGCCVPCGDWEKENDKWHLSSVVLRSLSTFSEVVELYCPPGTFIMGNSAVEGIQEATELPPTEVILDYGFWMLETTVTQEMWEDLMGNNPSFYAAEGFSSSQPMEWVSWLDAVAFCNALSRVEGLEEAFLLTNEQGTPGTVNYTCEVKWKGLLCEGYRLPTEAEWEYAARAGHTGSVYGKLEDIAWYEGTDTFRPMMVKSKTPNAWGFYDMLGNVDEYCLTPWTDTHPGGTIRNPEPKSDSMQNDDHVLRGGFCDSTTEELTFSLRDFEDAFDRYRSDVTGFRVVRTATSKDIS